MTYEEWFESVRRGDGPPRDEWRAAWNAAYRAGLERAAQITEQDSCFVCGGEKTQRIAKRIRAELEPK